MGLAGAEMASVYRPAATGLTVGGDFYDVLRTGDQSWFIAIGDVQGKGPLAASTTAAVRWAFRTSASGTSDPMRIVDTINAGLLEHDAEEGLCTLGLVPAQRRGTVIEATCVSAGHPLPRLVRSGAPRVTEVGRPGTLLGVVPQSPPRPRRPRGGGHARPRHRQRDRGAVPAAEGRRGPPPLGLGGPAEYQAEDVA